jgi:hypothetical protein
MIKSSGKYKAAWKRDRSIWWQPYEPENFLKAERKNSGVGLLLTGLILPSASRLKSISV